MLKNTPPTSLRSSLLLATLAFAMTAGGCNIVAPILALAAGPAKVKRMYELPSEPPTVLFLDDRTDANIDRATLERVAETADKLLLEKAGLSDLITGRSALEATMGIDQDQPVPVSEIGRRVNADVVIYVRIEEYRIIPDGDGFIPSMSMRVRVVDVANKQRLWPDEGSGMLIRVSPDSTSGLLTDSLASRSEARQVLSQLAGTAIAQLFFTHYQSDAVRDPTPF